MQRNRAESLVLLHFGIAMQYIESREFRSIRVFCLYII